MSTTTKSNRLESNPFFVQDVMRWGQREALAIWLSQPMPKSWYCNPVAQCKTCEAAVWASATKPAMCHECYERGDAWAAIQK
jgi:hypothetical protein